MRYRFPGRDLVNAFFMSPLILPTVVIGIALLQFYNQLRIGSTAASLVLGHVIVTTPYAIRLIAASLTGLDPAIERAARTSARRRSAPSGWPRCPSSGPASWPARCSRSSRHSTT